MTYKEQLAKAFCEASGNYKWDATPPTMKLWYLEGIDAVLKAMREPTEEMLEQAWGVMSVDTVDFEEDMRRVWQLMLDEARK